MKTFLRISFFFFIVTQICFAQWVQIGLADKAIKEIAARNSNIVAVTTDSAVYSSTNNGINWSQIVNTGARDIAVSPQGTLFMVSKDSLYNSSDNGNSWINLHIMLQLPSPYPIAYPANVTVSPLGIVFCGIKKIAPKHSGFIVPAFSTDNGFTWSTPPGDSIFAGHLFDFRGQCIITYGERYTIMGGLKSYMYLSSDNGQSWTFLGYPSIVGGNALSMCLNGNILIGAGGLYISTDSCNTWIQVSTMVPKAGLSIESGGMLIGTDSLGVFLFSDNADSLGSFNEGLTNLNVQSLAIDNNDYVYVGTDNGLWRRPLSEIVPVELTSFTAQADNQKVILKWTTATELNNNGFEIQRRVVESDFATVGFVRGEGTTTNQREYYYIDKNLVDGKYLYRLKQVDYNGTYEYSNVIEVDVRSLNEYALEQNYPNPFNPSTTIGYVLREKTTAKLMLLNAIGEEVAVLVNEEQDKGFHKVNFNASTLSSGVYFYRLQAGDFVQTKKMILLK